MIGLAVMGANFSRNVARNGFCVSAYDVTPELSARFKEKYADVEHIEVHDTLEAFINSLSRPRKVMMLIRAGKPVDEVIERLIPLLDQGDIIIDGGNSHYGDTVRRTAYVESKGLFYIGTGVSGGEEGALNGPSLMPGGSPEAWQVIKPIFQTVCAHAPDGSPCCDWVGENGAGHFVKMIHNGIEYGDMQLICEAYHLMHDGMGMSNEEMSNIFKRWNQGDLDSYLIQITADILSYRDPTGESTLDSILDAAGQKGTGKWTGITALEEGAVLPLIVEAVFARSLSAQKEERVCAAKQYQKKTTSIAVNKESFVDMLGKALYICKILSYAQGYSLMRAAAKTYSWKLDYGTIAMMWRGGCIIRSRFLEEIKRAFDAEPALENLLMNESFCQKVKTDLSALRLVVCSAAQAGIPMPAFFSALSYFDGYTSARLPANLLQAQRDYFGAHTYERVDTPRGIFHHTNWTGDGGDIASFSYNA